MDSELNQLVQRFQSLQKQNVATFVNDRSAIEILLLVTKAKRLVDVFYSTDGKEVMTRDHLKRELLDEVRNANGRLNVIDLPGILNVELNCVEQVIPSVLQEELEDCAREDELYGRTNSFLPAIQIVGGEIILRQYLENLIFDAKTELKERGIVNFSEFAKAYHLSTVFCDNLLKSSIDGGLLCDVVRHESCAYSTEFLGFQRRIVLSALFAVRSPVTLQELCTRHPEIYPSTVAQTVWLVVATQNAIPGRIEGLSLSKHSSSAPVSCSVEQLSTVRFIPYRFEKERSEGIQNMYLSNGAISYQQAAMLGVPLLSARAVLIAKYNAPLLKADSTDGNDKTNKPSKSKSRGNAKGNSSNSSSSGFGLVICSSSEFPNAGHPFKYGFVADKTFLRIASELETIFFGTEQASGGGVPQGVAVPRSPDPLHPDVQLQLSFDLAEHLPSFTVFDEDFESYIWPRLTNLVPALKVESGKIRIVQRHIVLHAERVWLLLRGPLDALFRESVKKSKGLEDVTPRKIRKLIAQIVHLDLESNEEELKEMFEIFEPFVSKLSEEILTEIRTKGQSAVKQWRQRLRQEMDACWKEVSLLNKALCAPLLFNKDSCLQAEEKSINRFLVASRAVPLVGLLVLEECSEVATMIDELMEDFPNPRFLPWSTEALLAGDSSPSSASSSSSPLSIVTTAAARPENLKDSLNSLSIPQMKSIVLKSGSTHLKQTLLPLIEAAQKDFSAFVDLLSAKSADGNLGAEIFHSISKKTERSFILSLRNQMVQKIAVSASDHRLSNASETAMGVEDYATIFSLCCTVVLLQQTNYLLYFPGKSTTSVVEYLKRRNSSSSPVEVPQTKRKNEVKDAEEAEETVSSSSLLVNDNTTAVIEKLQSAHACVVELLESSAEGPSLALRSKYFDTVRALLEIVKV